LRRRRRKPYEENSAGGLVLDRFCDLEILAKAGEGGRSTVYRARWKGEVVALKLYKADAVERHVAKHDTELARYEYERNLAFFEAPGLARYVARPLAYLATPSVSAFVQELVEGPLSYFWYRDHGADAALALRPHLEAILEGAHAAGLYDVDLHSMNVVVTDTPEGPLPKIFDFNLIPFHVHPPNFVVGWALRLGLLDVRSRDLRKLRNFHDFSRVERKLLKYY
jgi:serine/threonine protein kinase